MKLRTKEELMNLRHPKGMGEDQMRKDIEEQQKGLLFKRINTAMIETGEYLISESLFYKHFDELAAANYNFRKKVNVGDHILLTIYTVT